ncbi:MAG: DUF350 domain-containing protein [Hellea sp.]|nr:DUF350 domain-containing protein [Hellea sp.]
MNPVLRSLDNGFPDLIIHLGVLTIIYVLGIVIYVKLTPHKELELVQDGNMAAATTFSALVIGLVLPLAAVVYRNSGIWDIVIWGVVSLFLQLFLFRVTDFIFRGMPGRIENNEMAPALVLSAFKIAGSIALASALVTQL